MTAPDRILPDEDRVGRGVFSRKERDFLRKKGRARAALFFDSRSPAEISVHRLAPGANGDSADHPDLAPDETMAEIGDREAKARSEKSGERRTFYGWGELSAGDAAQERRVVRAAPLPDNPWHADIVLPEEDADDKDARWRHAEDLAALALWRPRPAG